MEKRRTRGIGIRTKILLPTSMALALVSAILGINSYGRIKEGLIAMGVEEAQMAAVISTKDIDVEQVKEITAEKRDSEEYKALIKALDDLKQICGIEYMYILYTDGSKVYYEIDVDDTENVNEFGSVFEVPYEELKPVFDGEMYVQDYIDSTKDGDLISAYMPLADSQGNVVSIVGCDYDASGVVERLEMALKSVIQISLICLVIALAVLELIVGTVIKSLRKVDGKIYELVHNEGDLTQKLNVRTGDEMEMIAENVNGLLGYMHEIMLNISQNSEYLRESSRTVSNKLSNANEEVADVSSVMEEMSAAMEETSASLDQINESIRQIFESIESIYKQAEKGRKSSAVIMKTASEVYNRAVEDKEDAVRQVSDMAVLVEQKVEKSKNVQEISALTKNIISITEKTNLLALNASIEAASAGEAGKGFMVVAKEIGKLAANSAASASEIQKVTAEVIQTVDELAAETKGMLKFMNETAIDGYEKLLETSKSYHSDVGDMDVMMQSFAAESEQIKINMDTIRNAVEDIKIAVSESASGVVSVAETSVNLTNHVGDIEKEANSNLEIVENLNGEVGKFKL